MKKLENCISSPRRAVDRTNVIYEYSCSMEDCHLLPKYNKYIGYTTCALTRRLTYHLQNGSIKNHEENCQNKKLSRTKIVENTKIIYKNSNFRKLIIMEALLIKLEKQN